MKGLCSTCIHKDYNKMGLWCKESHKSLNRSGDYDQQHGWAKCDGYEPEKKAIAKTDKPETFEQALDSVLTELRTLMLLKQKDYGPGNIMSFGELGVLVRANDKLERLKNLNKSGKTPNNESVDDSWKDLSNYGIIALMLRRGIFTLPME